jgi:hypothetical protein
VVLISTIVSGGQTGADQGALEAAIYCELPHGGWCPKGRKSEGGRIPDKYQLKEHPSADYLARTEANVVDSDATLVFTHKAPTGGSLRTIEFAAKHRKPWLNIPLGITSPELAADNIVTWLKGEYAVNDYEGVRVSPPNPCILNVAGSRESKNPGIQDAVEAIMVDVISKANGKLFYPMAKPKPMML